MIRSNCLSASLVLVLAYGWLPSVRAAEPVSAAPQVAASSPTGDERELRRVLHLGGGQTIRVVSRKAGDRWEYKQKDAWKGLEPGQVVRVVLESELLREWKAKQAATGKNDTDARVALAQWAAERGLAREGLEELDRVLTAAPDHAGARELLAARAWINVPSLDVPAPELGEAQDALFRMASASPPAAREIAVRELSTLADREALRARLERELRSNVVLRRSFATLALRRLFPGDSLKPLLMHAVLDPSEEVRRGASYALRTADEPGLIVPVVKALESQSSTVRANAGQALGDMGYAAAVEPLVAHLAAHAQGSDWAGRSPHGHIFVGRQVAYIQDFDVEVASGQSIADPQVNVVLEGSSLDAAVVGVQQVAVTVEMATLRRSLEKLTGASPGKTSRAWLDWWAANAEHWRSADPAQPTKPATGAAEKG